MRLMDKLIEYSEVLLYFIPTFMIAHNQLSAIKNNRNVKLQFYADSNGMSNCSKKNKLM